jgi:CMP-N-acetylneuraminic acid synthetase
LYQWIVATLLEVPEISGLVIDTDSDDAELWKLAENPKVKIKKRAPKLVGDFVSMNEIIWDYVETASETDFFIVASNERSDLSLGVFIRFYKALITETEFSQSPF